VLMLSGIGMALLRASWLKYSALLKSYGVLSAIGDHYAKVWPVEAFARHGIRYTQSALFAVRFI